MQRLYDPIVDDGSLKCAGLAFKRRQDSRAKPDTTGGREWRPGAKRGYGACSQRRSPHCTTEEKQLLG